MNTTPTGARKTEEGSSLFLVMTLIVIAFLMLASALSWSQNNALTTARNNQYWRTITAAEAATEKVLTRLATDFQGANGESAVYSTLTAGTYGGVVPTASDNNYWSPYVFSDGQGSNGRVYVNLVAGSRTNWTSLNSQYSGLFGFTDTFQVKSYARDTQGRFNVSAGVQQNVQLATVPAFQFAIFYNTDLEMEPGKNMTVTGRVHANGQIYQWPSAGATLTYQSDVTASGQILKQLMPGDPQTDPGGGAVVYMKEHNAKAPQLTLPINPGGSDPNTVYEILRPPPVGGDSDPALAAQRFYNVADIVIKVTDTGVTATSGSYNLFLTPVVASSFVTVSTNKFYNGRELKGVNVIDIDVSKFKTWADSSLGGAANLWTLYGREPNSIYVQDKRAIPAGTQPGVRLINGSQLPNGGLTVATHDPLYVKGDFNTKDSTGTSVGSDTTHTKPSSLVADAVTVLSNGWTDAANATSGLGNNHAANSTTVNAAFMSGIVQTTTSSYSGGVENFPRFLESWSSQTLTYNGSMVVMFYSKVATGLWRTAGAPSYYGAPTRNWAFDNNFLNPAKMPPGTPALRVLVRGDWLTLGKNPAS